MPKDSIAILPRNGSYLPQDHQSIAALTWLRWTEETRGGIYLYRSGGSVGGEKKIGPYKVDGYYKHADGPDEVFEFLGCYYHGCPKCHDKITWNKRLNRCMGALYGEVLKRCEYFQSLELIVTTIWGCEFKRLLATDEKLALMYATHQTPLVPRDGFFGGRTENFRTRWTSSTEASTSTTEGSSTTDAANNTSSHPQARLVYVDICSLYPFVNATCVYPSGHPDRVLTSNIDTASVATKYFGLVKCCVLPPRNLLIPVLPMRHDYKLFFPLCRECVIVSATNKQKTKKKKKNQPQQLSESLSSSIASSGDSPSDDSPSINNSIDSVTTTDGCKHLDRKRSFWGTFCTPELALAVEKGYKVLSVSEVWDWGVEKQSADLFKDYIRTFLKTKTEASGWPAECEVDDEKKEEYIQHYYEREGVLLDPANIKKNDGLRFISKLLLNSFWGYLGMRDNLPKTTAVKTYGNIVKYFKADDTVVTDMWLGVMIWR
jgi:hypothetical protein